MNASPFKRRTVVAATVAGVLAFSLPALASTPVAPAASLSVVTSGITAGLTLKALPAGVTPTLSNASADGGDSFAGACGTGTGPCEFGAPAPAPVIDLFGDSHAIMWLPAIVTGMSSTYHISLKWGANCPMATVTIADEAITSGAACNAFRARAISDIIASKPRAVVLFERTANVLQPGGKIFTDAQWQAGVTTTISALKAAKIKVIVFGDNPSFPLDPLQCLAIHGATLQSCTQPAISSNPNYVNHVKAEIAAAKVASVPFVASQTMLCTTSKCPLVINKFVVYQNWSHITASYSKYLSKIVAGLLTPLVK